MKSQKGVTLTSLVLYIMLVLIVLGILSVITASFQSNLKEVNKEGTKNSEVDSFNMYFLQEVKKQGNKINTISGNEILFTTGNKFSFRENMIYLNDNIKIAENIENCAFSDSLENGKTIITVTIKAKDAEERSIEYVLSNEKIANNYEDENNYTTSNTNKDKITLPSGYKQIEYIQSTGTQYINTNIYATNNLIIHTRFELQSNSSYYYLFGAHNSSSTGYPGCSIIARDIKKSNSLCWRYGNSEIENTGVILPFDTIHTIELSYRKLKLDEIEYNAINSENWSNIKYPMYIFTINIEGNTYNRYTNIKLYEFIVHKGNEIYANFIPCLDNDGVTCLYDTVSKQPFYNQGTGDFIAGPEV